MPGDERGESSILEDEKRANAARSKEAADDAENVVIGEGGRMPGNTAEYSAWDIYNNEAKKVDTESVNDWRDSLNSLLLFVSIHLNWATIH